MTRVDLATLDPAFAELARSGETIVLYEDDAPVAELKPIERQKPLSRDPDDPYGRAAAFGWCPIPMSDETLHEALRPMTDEEAERFIETGDY